MSHTVYLIGAFFLLAWLLRHVVSPAIAAVKYRRLRFARRPLLACDTDSLPALVQARLPSATAFLEQHGFDTPVCLKCEETIPGLRSDLHYLLAQHPASHSWALLLLHNLASEENWWNPGIFTCLADGTILYTSAGEAPDHIRLLPEVRAENCPLLPDKLWERHQQRLAGAGSPALPQTQAAICRLLDRIDLTFDTPELFTPNDDGSFSPTLRFGWQQYLHEQQRLQQRQQLLREHPQLKAERQAALQQRDTTAQQLDGYHNYLAVKQQTRGSTSGKGWLLAISVVLFALAFGVGLDFSWLSVLMLIGVLLLHESGHLFGMWLFGYRDLGMLFIPFLGALASGRKEQVSPWQEAVILLLGPLPGYLLGLFLLANAMPSTPDWVHQLAWMAILVNAFNLLPFPPLDGGQLMNLAIFNRFPRLQPFLLLLSVILLGWLGVADHSTLAWVLAFFLLMALPASFRESGLARELRADGSFRTGAIEVPALLGKLGKLPQWQLLPLDARWPLLDALLLRLRRSQTSRAAGLGIFLLWAGCLLLPPLLVFPAAVEQLQPWVLPANTSPAEQLEKSERLYANADKDVDKATHALGIMMLQEIINQRTNRPDEASVRHWWEQAKQLTASGRMTPGQRGKLLLQLASRCHPFEDNCDASYLRQALMQFDAARDDRSSALTLLRLARLDYLPIDERLATVREGIRLTGADKDLAIQHSELLWTEGTLLLQQGQREAGEAALFASLDLPASPHFDSYRQFQRTRLANQLVADDDAPRAIGLLEQWRRENLHAGNTDAANEDAFFLLTLLFRQQPQVAAGYVEAASRFDGFGPIEQALGQLLLGIAAGQPDYPSLHGWSTLLDADGRDELHTLWLRFEAAKAGPMVDMADDTSLAITRDWYLQMQQLTGKTELLPVRLALERIAGEQENAGP